MPTVDAKRMIEEWRKSPIIRHYSFSDKKLWDKQEEILWSVRNNKFTAVSSGNSIGKSFIAADVVMDYLSTHVPAKVITTAPTFTQVEGILWKEIISYCGSSKLPIGAEPNKTELILGPDTFAKGISTNKVGRLQGWHSPYLLAVIDEASGVDPEIWRAIHSLNPHRMLVIGNPLEISGDFYEAFQSSMWNKIQISCYECVEWQDKNGKIPGLVDREWIEERRNEWGENSPLFAIHVKGEFPEETEDTLISRAWVDKCREIDLEEDEEQDVRVAGYDVATKHGTNETIEVYRYGHTIKHGKAWKRIPITETAANGEWLYKDKRLHNLAVDSDGVGEGVSDIWYNKRVPHVEFHGGYGDKPIDKNKFKNLRTQFYWIVAKKLEKGLYDLRQLDKEFFEILKNQLCSIKIKAPDAMRRIQIETKEDLSGRGIKSPDYADAFVYAEYAYYTARYTEILPYKYT